MLVENENEIFAESSLNFVKNNTCFTAIVRFNLMFILLWTSTQQHGADVMST
jgi:hypothetical protein